MPARGHPGDRGDPRREIRDHVNTLEVESRGKGGMLRRMREARGAGDPALAAEEDGRGRRFAHTGTFRCRAGSRFTVDDPVYVAGAQGRRTGALLLAGLIEASERRGKR